MTAFPWAAVASVLGLVSRPLTSPGALVKVQFDVQGCFGGTQRSLRLRLGADGAELSGMRVGGDGPREVKRSLSRGEGLALMKALIAATTLPELASSCRSTTAFTATVEWACPSGALEKAKVEFLSHGCNSGEGGEMYERALGIHEVAAKALDGSAP